MKKVILVSALCLLGALLFAQEKKTVAVLEFEGGTGQDAITLADLFGTRLANKRVFNVVTRTSVEAIMKEHNFQRTGVTDTENIKAIGELVNADYIIVGKITTLGDIELLTIQMLNVESGYVESGDDVTFKNISETLTSIDTMVAEIAGIGTGAKTETTSYKIGDVGPGGGLVFYISGNTYLECSDTLGSADWAGAKRMAKSHRGGGYTDWELPNKDELNYIYENLVERGFITASGAFWSSSEYSSNYAWYQYFGYGSQDPSGLKTSNNNVRAIRAFNYSTL